MELRKPTINILTHLLDDDHDFITLVEKVLDKHPEIEYKVYSDVNVFISSIKEDKNISIIDYDLKSDINGLQLSKIILEKNPLSYVIMLSSQSDIEVVTEFYENDGFRYINKSSPNSLSKLVETIHKAKAAIQRHLDFHFNVIERFNKTQETINNARQYITCNTLGNNS